MATTKKAPKPRKLTSKALDPMSSQELRAVCLNVMGMSLTDAYNFKDNERRAFFVQSVDTFLKADLARVALPKVREEVVQYLKDLQAYLRGEGAVPVYAGMPVEDVLEPQVVSYVEPAVWEQETDPDPDDGPVVDVAEDEDEVAKTDEEVAAAADEPTAQEPAAAQPGQVIRLPVADVPPAPERVANEDQVADEKKPTTVFKRGALGGKPPQKAEPTKQPDLGARLDELEAAVVSLTGQMAASVNALQELLQQVRDEQQQQSNVLLFVVNESFVEPGTDPCTALEAIPDQSGG